MYIINCVIGRCERYVGVSDGTRDIERVRILTTFCLSKSSLSHFSLVTSCRKVSTLLSVLDSTQRLHCLFGVSAEDMLSSPVSLSAYVTAPSKSTLFKDDESLSDIVVLKIF